MRPARASKNPTRWQLSRLEDQLARSQSLDVVHVLSCCTVIVRKGFDPCSRPTTDRPISHGHSLSLKEDEGANETRAERIGQEEKRYIDMQQPGSSWLSALPRKYCQYPRGCFPKQLDAGSKYAPTTRAAREALARPAEHLRGLLHRHQF